MKMTTQARFIGAAIVVILAVAGIVAATNGDNKDAKNSATATQSTTNTTSNRPAPRDTRVTFTGPTFSLKFPQGWKAADQDRPKTYRYTDNAGNVTFILTYDYGDFGGGPESTSASTSDQIWVMQAKGKGVEIKSKSSQCPNSSTKQESTNESGDVIYSFNSIKFFCDNHADELHIDVKSTSTSGSVMIGNHTYEFSLYVPFMDQAQNPEGILNDILASFSTT